MKRLLPLALVALLGLATLFRARLTTQAKGALLLVF